MNVQSHQQGLRTGGRGLRLATVCLSIMLVVCVGLVATGYFPLFTPDQQAYRLFRQNAYAEAAQHFADPLWKSTALYEAGEFEAAANILSGFDTPEAAYNQGNALVMQGQYETAVARYERALQLRPGWEDANVNLEIARSRMERVKKEGGDMTGGQMGADDITFTKNEPPPGTGEEQAEGGKPLSDSAMREAWLRQVQTKPADFLRSKFAYQLAMRGAGTGEP